MRYRNTTVFLIVVVIATAFPISLVSATSVNPSKKRRDLTVNQSAGIGTAYYEVTDGVFKDNVIFKGKAEVHVSGVEWKADYDAWLQVEDAEGQKQNKMGQVLQASTATVQPANPNASSSAEKTEVIYLPLLSRGTIFHPPTPTLTSTPTPTPTQTLLPTYTPIATNTPLPTYTPTPTSTSIPSPTNTPTPTLTSTPTPTPTQTLLPTYTPIATNTPLPTYTPTPTSTSIPSPTNTPTPTPTPYPTSTPYPPQPSGTPTPEPAGAVEFYGTFHAVGLHVQIAAMDDPEQNATAAVEYRPVGGTWRQGLPMVRVSEEWFATSLFWLTPGTEYEARVTISDPGGVLDGAIYVGSGSTRGEISIPAPSLLLYVAPDGTGSTCTLAAPCTLAEGLGQAVPGTEIVLRGGTYYVGELNVPAGADGSPVVVRAYEAETPILDGSDPAAFTWTDNGYGVWSTTANADLVLLVVHDGKRLFRYTNYEDLQSLSWELPGFYVDGRTVYVHLEGNIDPNGEDMAVGYRQVGMYMNDWIVIDGLTFRYYSTGYKQALQLFNASDNVIQNCIFYINFRHVYLKYGANRNVIQNNEFVDTMQGWPWSGMKAYGGPECGAVLLASSAPPRGNVIRYNVIHGTGDGMQAAPWQFGQFGFSETDIYENVIYDVIDDGIEVDGMTGNVRVWGNQIDNALQGISFAPAEVGPVYAIRNLITNHSVSAIKTGTSKGHTGTIYLFHNTAVGKGNAYGVQLNEGTDQDWELIVSRNNIWYGAGNHALRDTDTTLAVDLDYDLLWNDGTRDLVRWGYDFYADLPSFVAATGQEAHGIAADPDLNADYKPNTSSPLIDAGIHIPGVNDDYGGSAPDIGAFE